MDQRQTTIPGRGEPHTQGELGQPCKKIEIAHIVYEGQRTAWVVVGEVGQACPGAPGEEAGKEAGPPRAYTSIQAQEPRAHEVELRDEAQPPERRHNSEEGAG